MNVNMKAEEIVPLLHCWAGFLPSALPACACEALSSRITVPSPLVFEFSAIFTYDVRRERSGSPEEALLEGRLRGFADKGVGC